MRRFLWLGLSAFVAWARPVAAQPSAACLPAAQDELPASETPESAAARALADAEAGRMDQAAARARAAILASSPSADVSKATDAYMRAMNGLVADRARQEACLRQIASDTERFGRTVCGAGSTSAKSCATFVRAGSSSLQALADLVVAGGRDEDPPDPKRMREAGRLYLDAFERSRASCGKERGGACEAPDEQLFNASAAFSRAGDLTQAMRALSLLLELPDTLARPDLVTRAAFQGGMRLLSMADFEGATRYFERASRQPSKEASARDALENLAFLRMALGDTKGAQRAADDLTKHYGARADIGRIDVALGRHLAEAGDHAAAVRWLERVMRRVDQSKSREDRIEAHATLARSLGALDRREKAEKEWRVVMGLSESLPRGGGGEGSAGVVATTLRARGEALVALARPAVDEALAFRIKKSDVVGMKEKRAKVERAEEKLLEVLRMPMPPPDSVVEAGALAAKMRRQLWAQTHVALGADAAQPLYVQAKAAQLKCEELSSKLQHTSAGARACTRWLEKHFPAERRPLTELEPTLRSAPSRLPPPQPIGE